MTLRTPGRHTLAFVLLTVLIDMIGIGLLMPVLPELIEQVAGANLSGAARLGGVLLVLYGAMQFVFGPVIGNLSDAFGRRPVLLISVGGLGIDYALTALAPNIGWLVVGRVVAGLCGASHSTANAYIADITPPEGRARAFGMVGAAFGIGFVIGPALGGLLGSYGPRVPFVAAATLSLINFVYGLIVLPETLPAERRRPFRLARANPLGTLLAFRHSPVVLVLAAVLFLHVLAGNVYPAVWSYFMIDRFGWSTSQIGLSLAWFGAISALVQGFLVGPVTARFGERWTVVIGLVAEMLAGFGFATATQGWMIYAVILVTSPQGFAMAAINALMSREVGDDAQGALQGGIASLMSIAAIIGPFAATQLFGAFTGPGASIDLPGAPLLAGAAVSVAALALFVMAAQRRPLPRSAV